MSSEAHSDQSDGGVRTVWEGALPDEVEFWDRWVASKGLQWQRDFDKRIDPGYELQTRIKDLIVAPEGATVRVLDVGAGPLTALGKVWQGRTFELTAVDPLADDYDRVLAKHGITPPVRTIKGDGERLTERFPRDHFDLAYAQNCLDHSYDPMEAIRQMVAVVKDGGVVELEHAANEAEIQKYEGLHQWNFCAEGEEGHERLILWREGARIDVGRELEGLAEVVVRPSQGWVGATIRKGGRPASPEALKVSTPETDRFHQNLAETKHKHEATPYYETAEGAMQVQWRGAIEPRLAGMDFTCVLELAPGHGRNTAKLRERAAEIYLVDINESCIEACRKRFGDGDGIGPDGRTCRMHYAVNDGFSLPMIPSGAITLVYSWDAMVHFDKGVVRKYVHEFARVMKPGAKGFVHHSNYGAFAPDPDSNWLDNPQWRSGMTRELFAEYCAEAGLTVLRQDLIEWDQPDLDCISVFAKPG